MQCLAHRFSNPSRFCVSPIVTREIRVGAVLRSLLRQAIFPLVDLQLRMARQETAALHFVAPGFQSVLFIDSGCQIGLVVFFRNFDGYVHAVIVDYNGL